MAAVTIRHDFGAQEEDIHLSLFLSFPLLFAMQYLGPDAMILVFLIFSLKLYPFLKPTLFHNSVSCIKWNFPQLPQHLNHGITNHVAGKHVRI